MTKGGGAWPEYIHVGPHDVRLVFAALDHRGDFEPWPPQIRIRPGSQGPALVEVIVHELLHAIWWSYAVGSRPNLKVGDEDGNAIHPDMTEEQIVARFGFALTLLLVDNPELWRRLVLESQRPTDVDGSV